MLGENPRLLAADCRNWTLTNSPSNAQTSLPIHGISNRFPNGDSLSGWLDLDCVEFSVLNQLHEQISNRNRNASQTIWEKIVSISLQNANHQSSPALFLSVRFNFCCSLSNFFSFCLLSLIERTISQIEKFATPHRLSLRWNPGMSKGKTL